MSISTTVFSEPLFNFKLSHYHRLATINRFKPNSSHSLSSTSNIINYGSSCSWTLKPPHKFLSPKFVTFATNTDTLQEIQSSDDVIFSQTHPINRIQLVYICIYHLFGLEHCFWFVEKVLEIPI